MAFVTPAELAARPDEPAPELVERACGLAAALAAAVPNLWRPEVDTRALLPSTAADARVVLAAAEAFAEDSDFPPAGLLGLRAIVAEHLMNVPCAAAALHVFFAGGFHLHPDPTAYHDPTAHEGELVRDLPLTGHSD